MSSQAETSSRPRIEPYQALALQTMMRGAHKRDEIKLNVEHIAELTHAAIWLSEIDLPVKLLAIPEGALQGFTDEIFDWEHEYYVEHMAIDLPGPETEMLGQLARETGTHIIAQAKVRHPDFPRRFFNAAFILDDQGALIHTHYKLQVFAKEHSTTPHDVWDKWTQLYGTGLDAFFPVADTKLGRIGCMICMEGSFPETARGLAVNGAEILYRPSYPEPYVSNGLWEVQNRARAMDNTCYVIAPNPAGYIPMPDAKFPVDVCGGNSMIVNHLGNVISNHKSGGVASYAGAIIDVEAMRDYRARSSWGNFLKDLRTEQYRPIYEKPIYPKNMYLYGEPLKHAGKEAAFRASARALIENGTWLPPSRG
jgi:predicted amidohydrolase